MNDIRTWLVGLFAAAAAVSVLYSLIPRGKLLVIARCSGGLVLLLALLRPALHWDSHIWENSFRRWQDEMETATLQMQGVEENRLASLIADRTAAYIQEKAEAMGLTCHPTVSTALRQGVPFPDRVWLDIPFHGPLSDCIAFDLDIPQERQIWQEDLP